MSRAVAIVLLLAACDPSPQRQQLPTTQTVAAPPSQPVAERSPDEQLLEDLTADLGPGERLFAVFQTSHGHFECELSWRKTPHAAAVFVGLARGKLPWRDAEGVESTGPFYNGLRFFRRQPQFAIHAGDPTETGEGGPGFEFPDEILPDFDFSRAGALALGNLGPDTNGSQFFITLAPANHLNGRYTKFGECPDLAVPVKIGNDPSPVVIEAVAFRRGD